MHRALQLSLLLTMTIATATAAPQPPRQLDSAGIRQGIRALRGVGSVLYVAAHPDDENTRLLAWLVAEKHLRAGYLSLTRGGGGQNLIGSEQGELLGIIRTHELLAARRVDGAEQLFTRARDFGYSKSAEESLRIWGHDDVLSDVVWAIRSFRPDVVITRFTTNPPNHGHHTASAILAAEAFAAAGDPKQFPEQLEHAPAWQPARLVHNVSHWSLTPETDVSAFMKLDVGAYNPLLGRSTGEIAADSRSMHKSQGFGVAPERGPILEYFVALAGQPAEKDPLEGLDLGWSRFGPTPRLPQLIDEAEASFDAASPERSIRALLSIRTALQDLPDPHWRTFKTQAVDELIAACAGLFLEARAAEPATVPGAGIEVTALALNRSAHPVTLERVHFPDGEAAGGEQALGQNAPVRVPQTVAVPPDAPPSTPQWLRLPGTAGLDRTEHLTHVSMPQGPPPLSVRFDVLVDGQRLTYERPVVYAWVDPIDGERYRLLEIAPMVTATLDREVYLFPDGRAQDVTVTVKGGREQTEATLRLEVPEGWSADPKLATFDLTAQGDERGLSFRVTPQKGARRGTMRAMVDSGERTESLSARTIEHRHIPIQTVRHPAEAELVPLALKTGGRRLGYVPGPGDTVAADLAHVGFDVTELGDRELARGRLAAFDAILVGVRAYNSNERLGQHHQRLMDYVAGGGTLVVQYNTNNRLAPLRAKVGPHPFVIGRGRVTDEGAAITPIDPKHPALVKPNRLEPADFEGWVQERGLYFAESWDSQYSPVFRIADPNEAPQEGAVLIAPHGKGAFIYTGLAFFRQLPAGVPGAYRLLANLLAHGR